ncbi:MAG: hypothetical protein AAGL49_15660 [Pseudomonadota bacterium]
MTVRGDLSQPGDYGHLGAYEIELRVREVVEIEPIRADAFDEAVRSRPTPTKPVLIAP